MRAMIERDVEAAERGLNNMFHRSHHHDEHCITEEEHKKPVHERTDKHSRLSYASSLNPVPPTNSALLTGFLLLNTMIGSGILNQPYVFRESGWIGGLAGFFVTAMATWAGLLLLTDAGLHEGAMEYAELASHAFGMHGERLVDVSIIVQSFGSLLGYILIVGTTLAMLLESWGCDSVACNSFWTTIIAVVLFILPICMLRHFGHLAWLSEFSIAAIAAILILVVVAGPIKHVEDDKSSSYHIFSIMGVLRSTGSIVFALSCASANFQAFISTEAQSRNLKSWGEITGNAVLIGALMCVVMGIAGYLSFNESTKGMILDNFNTHPYDIFKLLVVIHMIMYIPVNFVIMRYSVVKLFFNMRSELLSTVSHVVITIALLAATTIIVLILLRLGLASGVAFALILNLTGGIGGKIILLCAAFPAQHLTLNARFSVNRLFSDADPTRGNLPEGDAQEQQAVSGGGSVTGVRLLCAGSGGGDHGSTGGGAVGCSGSGRWLIAVTCLLQ
jgi:amino acid permease